VGHMLGLANLVACVVISSGCFISVDLAK